MVRSGLQIMKITAKRLTVASVRNPTISVATKDTFGCTSWIMADRSRLKRRDHQATNSDGENRGQNAGVNLGSDHGVRMWEFTRRLQRPYCEAANSDLEYAVGTKQSALVLVMECPNQGDQGDFNSNEPGNVN